MECAIGFVKEIQPVDWVGNCPDDVIENAVTHMGEVVTHMGEVVTSGSE